MNWQLTVTCIHTLHIRRIDIMEAATLRDERTDLVSTSRLGHGWAYQVVLANQQAIFQAGCKDGCDWLPA